MQIKHLPACERPRERLAKYGPDKLSSPELLAILLRSGTKSQNVIELSKKILKQFPQEKLLQATVDDLKQTHGLGTAKACEIVAMIELGKRLLKDKQSALLLTPQDVWENLKHIRDHRKEHFVVFYLDSRNQVTQQEIVSVGTLNASLVHPREVFEPAVKHLAAQIIVAHNHPSGNPEPSDDDLALTRRLVEAGKIMGIELLDHVVVTKTGWTSLHEQGLLTR
jgi:DNA repair protein RadC